MADDVEIAASLSRAALEVAQSWRDRLDLAALMGDQLNDLRGSVDLVAVGKAAPEMCRAASEQLGARVRRRFIASEVVASVGPGDVAVAGEHPVPGPGSLAAGQRLLAFLDEGVADVTVFLVSGGASSLCAAPAPPLTSDDLSVLWRHALASGWDVTRLNHARAATSLLGGAAVLRRVRSARSLSLIMVDNVVGGAPWVASGLTYEYVPTTAERDELVGEFRDEPSGTRERLAASLSHRARVMDSRARVAHENRPLVDPSRVLDAVVAAAEAKGWETRSMGLVAGDVVAVVEQWAEALRATAPSVRCLVGVGEVTIRVGDAGRGGRCQEFVARLATVLDSLGQPGACVALATDGRDYLPGVAGAWSDTSTLARLRANGVDVEALLERHDVHDALARDGALIAGGRTGWNLCDVYLVAVGPSAFG